VTEPPADILRRLRPIPTGAGPPRTRPRDVEGVRPDGTACRIEVVEAAAPTLLLFLAADCLGCRDLWEGLDELQAGLGSRARLVVVTKGSDDEDSTAVAALAGDASSRHGVEIVMSTTAYVDYRAAAPFYAVTAPRAVLAEGVAWGLEDTVATAMTALEALPPEH
jgi:hypothetical protein